MYILLCFIFITHYFLSIISHNCIKILETFRPIRASRCWWLFDRFTTAAERLTAESVSGFLRCGRTQDFLQFSFAAFGAVGRARSEHRKLGIQFESRTLAVDRSLNKWHVDAMCASRAV